jgi:mannose-1-phosphate guanylyltransferase
MPAITQAFVLGAGLGIRLRPLTDDLPKPLVPIFQKPLITFALDHLIDAGVTSFFVNTHHRPEWFAGIFPRSSYRKRSIQFFHEPDLLETAGGIANIAGAIAREPLLVYNGDILTDVPLAPLLEGHARAGNMVTLALRSNAEPKQIAFDPETGLVVDIRNRLGRGVPDEFLFTGIYIVDPAFVGLLERGVKRSVIPHFLEVIHGGGKVGGVVVDQGQWWDVGNRGAYLELHRELRALNFPGYPVDDPAWKAPVHGTAIVEPGVRVSGGSVISRGCRVGSGAVLEDTILWPGAQIASRSRLTGCIVCTRKKVSGTHHNVDL